MAIYRQITTSQLVRVVFQSTMGSHEGAFSAEPAGGASTGGLGRSGEPVVGSPTHPVIPHLIMLWKMGPRGARGGRVPGCAHWDSLARLHRPLAPRPPPFQRAWPGGYALTAHAGCRWPLNRRSNLVTTWLDHLQLITLPLPHTALSTECAALYTQAQRFVWQMTKTQDTEKNWTHDGTGTAPASAMHGASTHLSSCLPVVGVTAI
jgi:hypothetical protein